MTDEEKIRILVRAIERADATLEWTGNARNGSEWAMTTVRRVRRILRAALKKAGEGKPSTAVVGSAPLADEGKTSTAAVCSAPLADKGKPSNDTVPGSARAQKGKKA